MTSARLVLRPADTSTPRNVLAVELPSDWNGIIRITQSHLKSSSSVDRVMEWFTSRSCAKAGDDPGPLSADVSIAVESFIPSAVATPVSAVIPAETPQTAPAWHYSTALAPFADLLQAAISQYQRQLEEDLEDAIDPDESRLIVGLLHRINEFWDVIDPGEKTRLPTNVEPISV